MRHRSVLQWVNPVLALAVSIASVILIRQLLLMGLLPDVYVTLIALVTAVWDVIVAAVSSGEDGTKRNVVCILISVVLFAAVCGGIYLFAQVHRVMESITVGDESADVQEEAEETGDADETGDAEEAQTTQIFTLDDDEEVFVVYLSGIDDSGDIDETVSRSDVNILAVVNTNTGFVQLINTPRDYYVYLPDKNAYDKLTHAGLYGIECSMNTLAYLYDVEIDYYVRINFTGFETLIDDIGGIDIYVAEDFVSNDGWVFTAGWTHMDGETALQYARERKAFAEGDVQRGKNQMQVIEAIADQLLNVGSLASNFRTVMLDISDMLQTNMTTAMIYDLLQYQLSTDTDWTFSSYTVSGSSTRRSVYSTSSSVSVMIPYESDVEEAKALIQAALNAETADESGNALE